MEARYRSGPVEVVPFDALMKVLADFIGEPALVNTAALVFWAGGIWPWTPRSCAKFIGNFAFNAAPPARAPELP